MGFVTSFSLDTTIKPMDEALKVLTLGAYSDLSNILSQFNGGGAVAEPIVIGATVFKWILITASIFAIVRFLSSKLQFSLLGQAVLTIVALVAVMLFIATPFELYNTVEHRVAPFFNAISSNDKIDYTPTLLYGTSMLGKMSATTAQLFGRINSYLPSNVSVPSFENGFSIQEASVSWIATVIDLLLISVIVYLISKFSNIAAGVIGTILLMAVLGVGANTMGVILSIILSVAAIYFLINTVKILTVYPLSVLLILLAYIFQPPVNILVILLSAVCIMLMLPVFYLVAYMIYGAGELVEKREKLGMKKRPVKYVEEATGEWDVGYTAILMTLLFSAILALYGPSMIGMGTFFTIFFILVK